MPVVLPAAIACAPGHAASFDCRRPANGTERIICANRDLSQLDERLALTYKRFMSTSTQPYDDQREHTKWLAERDACKDSACVKSRYGERLAQLRGESSEWLALRPSDRSWVASDTGDTVCQAARAQLEALGGQDFAARAPERALGVLCGGAGPACQAASHAVSLDELTRAGMSSDAPAIQELLSAGAPVSVSRVDIDNDGVQDVRLVQRAGEAQCERSVALLGSADGKLHLETANGYEQLGDQSRLCGRERLTFFRYRDVNYAAALGEQRVYLLRGTPREGMQPVCGFKRRWTEQEKRAAYAVLKRNPDILRNAHILRPERDRTPDGRRMWAVQVRCTGGSLLASFVVDPRTLSPQTVVAPGSKGRCEAPRVAQELALPVPTMPRQLALQEPVPSGPGSDWQGPP
jgi:uncharacterized protein